MSEDSIEMLVVTLLFDGEPHRIRPVEPSHTKRIGTTDRTAILCPLFLKRTEATFFVDPFFLFSFDVVVALLFDGESTPNPISRAVPHEAHRND